MDHELGHTQSIGVGTERSGHILASDRKPAYRGMTCDGGGIEKGGGIFDESEQSRVGRVGGNRLYPRETGLRDIETIGRRAYRSKDILTRRFRIGIDADLNPCTALPRRSNRICKRLAGGIAPLGADGIFEIDDDGVGPAFM